MHHDTLDALAESLLKFEEIVGTVPGLCKALLHFSAGSPWHACACFVRQADVDAAYRRVPVAPAHRWACGVVFRCGDEIYFSQHAACPFGAVASVHAWERLGAAITHIARKFLHIAVLRYVDDLFAAERKESMEHALDCLARLLRLILGPGAAAPDKLEFGEELVILGVRFACLISCARACFSHGGFWQVRISLSERGFWCRPEQCKVEQWLAEIAEALSTLHLSPGRASKLAGKLAWGTTHLFHRLGRAMLRPLFDQRSRRDGHVCAELARSLV
jgi:hypothetical protein